MKVRIVSSVVLFPFLAALIIIGGLPLQFALMLLSVLGLSEIYNAISGRLLPVHFVGFVFGVIYYILINRLITALTLFLCTLFLISTLIFMVINYQKTGLMDCAVTVFGFFYVVFLMSFVYWVREYDHGQFSVWLIFISAWGCDTGAYFVGKTFGKHKMTPILSPNKTVEGAIGGVVVATLISWVYGYAVSGFLSFGEINTMMFSTILGCVGSVFSQLGDLTASAIKRSTGKKDFGNIIPGHGGIIDRFDSVLFTAPIIYFVMFILLRVSERIR